jgi:uncharacterized protein (TIGR00369 family)
MIATMHQPRSQNFEARVRDSFGRQAIMKNLRAEIVELAAGRVVLQMPFQANFTQQHGFMHAGAITTLLDSACGYSAFSLMDENVAVLTVEFKTTLIAPAAGQMFRAIAEVVKSGRNLTFSEGRAFAEDGGGSRLIATMSATLMAVAGRDDIQG